MIETDRKANVAKIRDRIAFIEKAQLRLKRWPCEAAARLFDSFEAERADLVAQLRGIRGDLFGDAA